MDNTLKEAKRLYDLGFSIIWLRPKSKRPIEMGWTKGPRKTWASLSLNYQLGNNLGVRLGATSKIGEYYLAVIDCDVKSEDPIHVMEMESKLIELFPEIILPPTVLSGRANGSQHIYILTHSPTKEIKLAESTTKNGRKPAWSIVLMGEGRQVVLPPSIHPETGQKYVWYRPLKAVSDLDLINPPTKEAASPTLEVKETTEDFKAEEVDLVNSDLSQATYEKIVHGTGVEDRSAALLGVTMEMVRCGFSDNEILSVLTNKEYFLGEVAYEHAHTNSRKKSVDWIRRFTLEKAKKEARDYSPFMEERENRILSDDEAITQVQELLPSNWRAAILRSKEGKGPPVQNVKNVITILEYGVYDDNENPVFTYNEFSGFELYGRDTPWGGRKGGELKDIDIIRIKHWFSNHWRFEPNNNLINEAIAFLARQHAFHPIRDYLQKLEWDGVPRLDNWLKVYLNARGPDKYLQAVSRKVLCAMVARATNPGVKFDSVLILEGGQGVGKSTSIRNLAGEEWYSDAHINISDKDSVLALRAVWCIELGELSGMRKADVDHFKEFITRTFDRIRVPYGHRAESFPRQCVFIGSTNNSEFLKDETGNRRFWPISVGKCDLEGIKKNRDQLFAEAKVALDFGEKLYLDDEDAIAQSVEEQNSRMIHDELENELHEFFEKERKKKTKDGKFDPECFQMKELFSGNFSDSPLSHAKMTMQEQKRVGYCLKKLKYKNTRKWVSGKFVHVWCTP